MPNALAASLPIRIQPPGGDARSSRDLWRIVGELVSGGVTVSSQRRPLRLYDRPANLFVAGFIGSPAMNLVEVAVDQATAHIGDYALPLERQAAARSNGRAVVGIRPDAWTVVGDTVSALAVTVDVVEELGADADLYGTASVNGSPLQVVARLDGRRTAHKGSIVRLAADSARVHLFDASTGVRLSG